MRKSFIVVGILAIASFVYGQQPAAEPTAQPAEKPVEAKVSDTPAVQPLEMTKSGTVQLVRDSSGKVIGINLIVTSYKVAMNDVAKQLEGMDGQKVRVRGTVSLDGDQRVITIRSIEPVTSSGGATAPAQGK